MQLQISSKLNSYFLPDHLRLFFSLFFPPNFGMYLRSWLVQGKFMLLLPEASNSLIVYKKRHFIIVRVKVTALTKSFVFSLQMLKAKLYQFSG